ncbi:hypothetical protein [Clostridium sp. BJN0001]|uniref:hypothetical protein n=1 Tax=Clostridium sp. BJN0001 TaxID=2930219 RepID=UPI001FD4E095|nr:hypothetical protein [Clostridium sp. BJN0001]
MLKEGDIYREEELFKLKKNGYKIFELNHKLNVKLKGGTFVIYKIVKIIDEVREIEERGSFEWDGGAILVEMENSK